MLDSLITSKTRIKLLLKFFANPNSSAYLRSLAKEFGESTNSIRLELNNLTKAGFLKTEEKGRKIIYKANEDHPLFPEINSLVMKNLGLDKIQNVIGKLGKVKLAFVTGDYAEGIDSGIVDLVVVGVIEKKLLDNLAMKAEKIIGRKIRPLVLSFEEFLNLKGTLDIDKALILWKSEDVEI